MGLQGSGTTSLCSDRSIEELIQSRPDSPVQEEPAATKNLKFPIRLQTPTIVISEHSVSPLKAECALSDVSDSGSGYPNIDHIIGPSSMIETISRDSTFDGSALDLVETEKPNFSHTLGSCPIVLQEIDCSRDTPVTIEPISVAKDLGLATGVNGPHSTDSMLSMNSIEEKPAPGDNLPLKYLTDGAALSSFSDANTALKELSTGPVPNVPNVPELLQDVTELALAPPTTPSNQTKRNNMKVKGMKVVRQSRRIVLREPILAIILGRKLAAPTSKLLEMVSRGVPIEGMADVTGGTANKVPTPVPAPL